MYEKSGLTLASMRGLAYVGAESVGERVATAAAALRRDDHALVYAYYSDLDSTGHRCGCMSDAWTYQLANVDLFVEQLPSALPPDAVLLVTADHGMVDVSWENGSTRMPTALCRTALRFWPEMREPDMSTPVQGLPPTCSRRGARRWIRGPRSSVARRLPTRDGLGTTYRRKRWPASAT